MRYTKAWVLMVLVITGICGIACSESVADDRVVTARATVVDERGGPISGIAVVVSTGREPFGKAGVTGSDGKMSVSVSIPAGATTLYCLIQPSAQGLSSTQTLSTVERYLEKIDGRAVKLPGVLSLVQSQSEYQFEFVVKPGISIGGRLVNASGNPVGGVVGVRGNNTASVTKADGVFKVTGVAKGEVARLCIRGDDGEWCKVVTITAEQTTTNVAMGDVVVGPPVNTTGGVRCVVQHWNLVGTGFEGWSPRLVLVREDLSIMRVCKLEADGASYRTSAQVPPGRYFVCVGNPATDVNFWSCVAVLGSSGGGTTLSGLGVPKIDIVEGAASRDEQIDMADVLLAYRAVRSYW